MYLKCIKADKNKILKVGKLYRATRSLYHKGFNYPATSYDIDLGGYGRLYSADLFEIISGDTADILYKDQK